MTMFFVTQLHYVLPMCYYLVRVSFFFKQKTAYEMRISDWSSDVCSSDLPSQPLRSTSCRQRIARRFPAKQSRTQSASVASPAAEIGRASCRERVCTYV